MKWNILKFESYEEVVDTINCLKLKKEEILTIDKDVNTGKITIVYYY